MDIDGYKIIVFKLDNQRDIFPEIDFPNIFRALSEKANAPVLGVIGNDDTEECGKTFIGANVFNIHKDTIKIGKQYFLGIQGVVCDDGSFKKWVKYKELNALRREIEDFYAKSLLKKHCNDVAFPELNKSLIELEGRAFAEITNDIDTLISSLISKIEEDAREVLTALLSKYHNIVYEIRNYGRGRGSCIGPVAIGESNAKKHLERKNKKCDKPPIIVSHTPPYGVLDIGRRFGIEHIGSVELRDFVLKNKIPLVICGHVHGYGGYIENIGKTTVVNVSSHDRLGSEGNIAIIDYEDTVKVKWIKVSDYDRSLRKIKDIGIYREALLRSNGVNTIDDLLNCTDDFLIGLKTRLLTSLESKKIFSTAENGAEELILTLLFKYNLSEEEFEKLTLKELDFDSKAIHFRRSHGKGEKRWTFLDNKTYRQLLDYTSRRNYLYRDPIFFSSKEDRATIERLYKKLNNVVNSFCKPIKPKGGIGEILGKELIEKAKAYYQDEPIIYNRMGYPEKIIYMDIETSPIGIDSSSFNLGRFYIYLIGVYDEENGYQCFITKDKKPQEKRILREFLNYLEDLKNSGSVLCAYNGHNFDFKYLDEKIRSKKLNITTYKKVEKIDLLEICRKNLYMPKGYSLSSVASYFGYPFKHPEKNGYHMGLEYQGFILGTLEEPDWEKIIEYNKDDVLAMKYIIESVCS
jgi:Icc-related predicted phosphoesterase